MVNSWHFYYVWARVRVCLRARDCVNACVSVGVFTFENGVPCARGVSGVASFITTDEQLQ